MAIHDKESINSKKKGAKAQKNLLHEPQKNKNGTKKNDIEIESGTYPTVPLRDIVLFPKMVIPLFVGREKSIASIEYAMVSRDKRAFFVTQKDQNEESPKTGDLYPVGVVGEILQLLKLPDGTIKVLIEGLQRASFSDFTENNHYETMVEILLPSQEKISDVKKEAMVRALIEKFEEYGKLSKKIPNELFAVIMTIDDLEMMCDSIIPYLFVGNNKKQEVLETVSVAKRFELVMAILNEEIEIMKVETQIQGKVNTQIEKSQKEYYLREKMKVIMDELGTGEDKVSEANEYRQKLKKLALSSELEARLEKEISRFEKMPSMAAESSWIRNYLDTVLELPWSTLTEDKLDIKNARKILDEDHAGLDKVKERILEYLAVKKLAGEKQQANILCLIGPPGVGKTSLARSIARAMNKKFVRVSLGGIGDESEIRGHRRTYVASMPGRIIAGLKQAGSRNPVFLLDEIDKLSQDFRGNPASAMLEVLDPEQNNTFTDHYVELPFDLSKVFFICTANSAYTIPRPLLDRMEIIWLSSYTPLEKLDIAKRYIVPKQLEKNGLSTKNTVIKDDAISALIEQYTREAGVREMERSINTIFRKVARKILEGAAKVTISKKNIDEFMGPPKYKAKLLSDKNAVGCVTGLAWTQVGGDLLQIESMLMQGKGGFLLTGQLGDVMKESARAAMTYLKANSDKFGLPIDTFDRHEVHIHIPEGATPKDGPSAGITLATALVSLFTEIPIKNTVAMTGEITLRGNVLPIGGLKEKLIAAHRGGITEVLIPDDNVKDLEEIPDIVKKEVKIIPVKTIDEVLKVALVKNPFLSATELKKWKQEQKTKEKKEDLKAGKQ